MNLAELNCSACGLPGELGAALTGDAGRLVAGDGLCPIAPAALSIMVRVL